MENPELLDLELGCNLGSVPATYVGIPLGARHKSTKVWDAVGENFRKRLALWKRQYIANEAYLKWLRARVGIGKGREGKEQGFEF